MPIENRARWLIRRIKTDFRKNQSLTNDEDIQFEIRLGETHLDSIITQRKNMIRVMTEGEEKKSTFKQIEEERQKNPLDIYFLER